MQRERSIATTGRAVVSAAFAVVKITEQSQLVMEPDFLTWICQFKKGRIFLTFKKMYSRPVMVVNKWVFDYALYAIVFSLQRFNFLDW